MSKKKPPDFEDAISKYREFYDLDPKSQGVMQVNIPSSAFYVGEGHNIRYESDKWERPKSHAYIHEHDRGVKVYEPAQRGQRGDTAVPEYIRSARTLVKLGRFLGLDYIRPKEDGWFSRGEHYEVLPARSDELYTIPNGRALLVISRKVTLKAIIWGGNLNVIASGINH